MSPTFKEMRLYLINLYLGAWGLHIRYTHNIPWVVLGAKTNSYKNTIFNKL